MVVVVVGPHRTELVSALASVDDGYVGAQHCCSSGGASPPARRCWWMVFCVFILASHVHRGWSLGCVCLCVCTHVALYTSPDENARFQSVEAELKADLKRAKEERATLRADNEKLASKVG